MLGFKIFLEILFIDFLKEILKSRPS